MPAPEATQTGDQQQQTQQQQTTQQPSGQQQQTPQGQQPNQTQQQSTSTQRPDAANNSGQDDRTRGIVADLQKERKARQQLEQQLQQATGALDQERRRIRALAGVDTPSPEQAELDAVRARVVELFPVLAKLDENTLGQLLGLSEQAQSINDVTTNHWTRHGRQMLDGLTEQVSEAIGKNLTDRQAKALQRAYVNECEADPEFLARHEAGDLKLIEEFAKAWVEDWFDTARVQVTQQEVSRFRPVPNGRDRNVQTTPPKKINFSDGKSVEDAMVESFKAHGGRFNG